LLTAQAQKKIMQLNKINIFFFISAFLTLLVFGWWTKLLLTKNEESWEYKIRIFQLEQKIQHTYIQDQDIKKLPEVIEMRAEWHQQQNFILFQGSFFLVALLFGIWKIRDAINKDIDNNLARSNFMFSITHELKSPIAAISLALQTLNRREFDTSKRQELTQNAMEDIERLSFLVDNILLAAQLQNYAPHFQPLDFSKILSDLTDTFSDKFPNAHFKFDEVNFPPINGDKQSLYSLFSNLLENALKYSGEKPEIFVTLELAQDKFICDVCDNGVGIPLSERRKIFDRFYRIGNELTRKSKGTGLGLFIVAEIVKIHGGTIRVLDNQPKGSIFRVILPQNS